MTRDLVFSVRLAPREDAVLSRLAERLRRERGDVVRLLLDAAGSAFADCDASPVVEVSDGNKTPESQTA
jgi:hypothetical protein